jgi:hypothetical protein
MGWSQHLDGKKETPRKVFRLVERVFAVTSLTNGDLYIGGWRAVPEETPEVASSTQAQPSESKDMVDYVKKYVNVDTSCELEYF